jgi:hypothetical protein
MSMHLSTLTIFPNPALDRRDSCQVLCLDLTPPRDLLRRRLLRLRRRLQDPLRPRIRTLLGEVMHSLNCSLAKSTTRPTNTCSTRLDHIRKSNHANINTNTSTIRILSRMSCRECTFREIPHTVIVTDPCTCPPWAWIPSKTSSAPFPASECEICPTTPTFKTCSFSSRASSS